RAPGPGRRGRLFPQPGRCLALSPGAVRHSLSHRHNAGDRDIAVAGRASEHRRDQGSRRFARQDPGADRRRQHERAGGRGPAIAVAAVPGRQRPDRGGRAYPSRSVRGHAPGGAGAAAGPGAQAVPGAGAGDPAGLRRTQPGTGQGTAG
ncbi:hypothetical protein OY671_012688, partial [Metschnikowia pulcherrima]